MNVLVEEYIEEMYLREDISLIAQKIGAKKDSILAALKSQNVDKVKATLSFLPKIPIDKVYQYSRKIPGFDFEYDKTITKMTGTPEERQIKAIALSALTAIKKNVKDSKVQKSLSDFKPDPHQIFVARDVFTALCLVTATYLTITFIHGAALVGYGAAASGVASVGAGITATGAALGAFWAAISWPLTIILIVILIIVSVLGDLSTGPT